MWQVPLRVAAESALAPPVAFSQSLGIVVCQALEGFSKV